MRWKYEREPIAAYQCCGCLHVRTGTLILGLLHLLFYILIASLLIVLLVRPQLLDSFQCTDIVVPTKPPFDVDNSTAFEKHHLKVLSLKKLDTDNIVVGLILVGCMIAVSGSLIYGTVLGHPRHMTAFFCVKLFEICTTGMAMLSYFSSTQELRRWIAAQPCWPLKQVLLDLDNNNLMALTLIVFVAVMFCKLYFIGVIWACYKYLQQYAGRLRETEPVVRRYNTDVMHDTEDTEMLLPPKYEDVIAMPPPSAAEAGPQPPAYSED